MDLQYSVMHATYCKRHIHDRWVYLGGHSNRLSVLDLHVACLEVPFAWNLCIQTQPHDIHLVPETVNHACESGHSLAGHCQVSLLLWEAWLHALRWHLRLPNVVQSFLSKSTDKLFFLFWATKTLSEPEKQFRLHFFLCAHVISTLYFMCKWQKDKKCVLSLLLSLTCLEALFLTFKCVFFGVKVWKIMCVLYSEFTLSGDH